MYYQRPNLWVGRLFPDRWVVGRDFSERAEGARRQRSGLTHSVVSQGPGLAVIGTLGHLVFRGGRTCDRRVSIWGEEITLKGGRDLIQSSPEPGHHILSLPGVSGSGVHVFNSSRTPTHACVSNNSIRIRKECEPRIVGDECLASTWN